MGREFYRIPWKLEIFVIAIWTTFCLVSRKMNSFQIISEKTKCQGVRSHLPPLMSSCLSVHHLFPHLPLRPIWLSSQRIEKKYELRVFIMTMSTTTIFLVTTKTNTLRIPCWCQLFLCKAFRHQPALYFHRIVSTAFRPAWPPIKTSGGMRPETGQARQCKPRDLHAL